MGAGQRNARYFRAATNGGNVRRYRERFFKRKSTGRGTRVCEEEGQRQSYHHHVDVGGAVLVGGGRDLRLFRIIRFRKAVFLACVRVRRARNVYRIARAFLRVEVPRLYRFMLVGTRVDHSSGNLFNGRGVLTRSGIAVRHRDPVTDIALSVVRVPLQDH